MTVQFETGITEANGIQTSFHYLKSRHLLRHKQNLAPLSKSLGNKISNGLRLTCARRTLNYEIVSFCSIENCQRLRAVGIHHLIHFLRIQVIIQMSRFFETPLCLWKPLTKQAFKYRMIFR